MGTLDPVETGLGERLAKAAGTLRNEGQPNSVWTRAMKDALRGSGPELGEHVWTAGGAEGDFGEWLVDLVRYDGNGSGWGARLTSIRLAMECEWLQSDEEALYDFYKLLALKADRKLMICEIKPGTATARLDLFREAIAAFQPTPSGERYMFALWDDAAGEFTFDIEVIA